ncbi:MAG TPA: metalloregulator ArsR/SmtB family transcription factor [Ktedonobacteraceae bacterium]|jgi:DNA-binding transcriptional ArsR family regulator|nr:metalloregulator ArsR/SmtB family transcription factor [Ktedonobacteraceae bacterium]
MISQTSSPITEDEVCQERAIHAEHVLEVRRTLLSTEEAARIASFFAVLSDPTRLQVVHALLNAPTGELCVCDIAQSLNRDDTTISHQLRILRTMHVVTMRKAGRVVYYRLVDRHIRQVLLTTMLHLNEERAGTAQQRAGGVI